MSLLVRVFGSLSVSSYMELCSSIIALRLSCTSIKILSAFSSSASSESLIIDWKVSFCIVAVCFEEQPKASSINSGCGSLAFFVQYITELTSVLRSMKAGKTKPLVGGVTTQSLIRALILCSSSQYLRPGSESETGQIAQSTYSYTSSDSSNFKLSLVLVITS